jgi:hypothetical protein
VVAVPDVMKWLALALATLAAVPARADDPAKVVTEDEGEPKLSLPTETDRIAWTKSGFRLGLGLDYGRFEGLRGAPSGRLLGPFLHAGLRLDADWSLYASFSYESASGSNGGLSGLRFVGTIDPTWHITRELSLAFGFGFGGLVEGRGARVDHAPMNNDVSITIPSADPPVGSCTGVGVAGVMRVAYAWVIGPRASTDLELAVAGQYTSCIDKTGELEPDNAQPIERTQYWPHVGVTLGWGVMWR